MEFITDRTLQDVLLGNGKGSYGPGDLNRVEGNVQALWQQLSGQGVGSPPLAVKTHWALQEVYQPGSWPDKREMDRYLENIKTLCRAYGLEVPLPETMEFLDYRGANQLEEALWQLKQYLDSTEKSWRFSGEMICEGGNE